MTVDQRRAADRGDNDTRQRLLDATIRLVQADGPAAATSRAITDAADANLAAITYYFGSKDALVAAAFADTGRRLLQPVIQMLSEAESPIEQMLQATRLLPEILAVNPSALRGYVHALAAAVHDPAVHETLATLHHDMATLLSSQIRAHQSAGIVPAWIDPPAMASVIISLVDGVAVTTAAALIERDPAVVGSQFAALLVHAALPVPPREPGGTGPTG
jgi:AcrR family transcriptional regulator